VYTKLISRYFEVFKSMLLTAYEPRSGKYELIHQENRLDLKRDSFA